jgi:hypothetical protein
MATGVASIVFASGTLVLPAQTLYDRQVLVDHVLNYARRGTQVRVRVDYTTWMVAQPEHPVACQRCQRHVSGAACHHPGQWAALYCVTCALARPRLTMALLAQLPAAAILHDVQARYAYAGEWVAWTRWPQATPAEIIEDMRLQRRFAPVLTWTCTEIRHPPSDTRKAPRPVSPRLGTAWAPVHVLRVPHVRRSA